MSPTVGVDAAGLRVAARAVRAGRLLLYPTETVYGLGGDARDHRVTERLGSLKGREKGKPVLVLIDTWERVAAWATPPEAALIRILSHEPPLPVTMLVPATSRAPVGVMGPEGLLGIRRTADSFCLSLIAEADAPLLSSSANRVGAPAPAHLDDVDPLIRADVDLVEDAGRRLPGVPSTVARLVDGRVEVVRPGAAEASVLDRVAAGGR